MPSLTSLTVIPLMIHRFFPPEIKETPNAVAFAHDELEKLGPLNRDEKILLLAFVSVVLLWITARWHGVDSTVIALLGITSLIVSRVLAWRDLMGETHAWEVFIWYGGRVDGTGVDLLCKPERRTYALWNNARTCLLRAW